MATPTEITGGTTPASAPSQPRRSNLAKKAGIRLQEYLFLCLENWYWFLISIAVCLAIGYVVTQRATPIYQKSASLIIKTDAQGRSMSANAALFSDLGAINATNSILWDEIQIIQSPDLMRDVVRKLNLEMVYSKDGRFRTIDLYGSQLPVQVSMPDLGEDDTASFDLTVNPNGEFTMTNLTLRGRELGKTVKGRIGTQTRTPLGRVEVSPAKAYDDKEEIEIHVDHVPVKGAAAGYAAALKTSTDDLSANMVILQITNSSPERAEDILAQLIASYNDRWMRDKRTLADNSSKFIDERVQLLQSELGSVENEISSFKSANLLPDVDAAASLYMSQATQASMALKDLRNQEYMAKYIRNYLRNSENTNKLLPSNAGLTNANLSGQIAQYNTKILERNSLVSQSSVNNPLVPQIDSDLSAMRGALIASIDNEIVALGEQIRSQEGLSGAATSKIASNPRQAKYLLSVERQQKVKEALYLYLLQKREENQLNQAFTSYNTRIVREPDGPNSPISPNKTNTMLIAFAIGLALPALWLFQREMAVHVVRGRRDIKGINVPFAGELPLFGKKQKLQKPSKAQARDKTPLVVVKENCRNSINEAFRVLRTNIDFMMGNDATSKVIMLTSANPGSGKTFVTFNLAKSFAIKGKKVIAIDLDMRKASLSKYVSDKGKGISDYLANRANDITSIIEHIDDCPNLSVIPVGTLPPNPTELLFSERLHALIEDLKVHYDMVFLDCPPVEVVADASIISKYADYTLFVIRAGVLDLSMLPVIEEMYDAGKYPNMSIVLNGTINPRNSYARRYGNPYSYGYGYGTGYTYSSDE